MGLLDKLWESSIDIYEFNSALWFWVKGDVTRQNIIDIFFLEVADETQLDALVTYYQGLSEDDKRAFFSDLHAASILAMGRKITKSKFQTLIGL